MEPVSSPVSFLPLPGGDTLVRIAAQILQTSCLHALQKQSKESSLMQATRRNATASAVDLVICSPNEDILATSSEYFDFVLLLSSLSS